jgi:hypothetical protein
MQEQPSFSLRELIKNKRITREFLREVFLKITELSGWFKGLSEVSIGNMMKIALEP